MKLISWRGKRPIPSKRWVWKLVPVALALAVGVFCFTTPGRSLMASASTKPLPIYCVDKGEEKVASLTFDAAWGNEDTQQLIDILGEYQVHVTFFVVGEWAEKYPESVKALQDAGHEIMNHSSDHAYFSKLTADQIMRNINACNEKVAAVTGVTPTLFRPPYGDYDDETINTVRSMGMYPIQWSVDSLDWKNPGSQAITDRVLKQAKPGSIILFHNAAKDTPGALPAIIEALQSKGYSLVPVSQLIYTENYTIDHTGMQYQN